MSRVTEAVCEVCWAPDENAFLRDEVQKFMCWRCSRPRALEAATGTRVQPRENAQGDDGAAPWLEDLPQLVRQGVVLVKTQDAMLLRLNEIEKVLIAINNTLDRMVVTIAARHTSLDD